MDDYISQIEDLVIHKNLFMLSALKMYKYLCSQGRQKMALRLMRRAVVHDNSKLTAVELKCLSKLDSGPKTLGNPSAKFNTEQLKHIKKHWKNNPHHPEYHSKYSDMSELDIIEMVCDWHARSVQFGNNLIEFVKARQENRFHFKESQFKKILQYCEVMVQ